MKKKRTMSKAYEEMKRGEEHFRKKRGLGKRKSRFADVRFDRVDDFGAVPDFQMHAEVDP